MEYIDHIKNQLVSISVPCVPQYFPKSGIGLFAQENIREGSKVITEEPIIAGQYSWGIVYGYLACHHCLRSLEPPLEMARRLTGDKSTNLPIPDANPTVKVPQFRFCSSCHIAFCSEDCLQTATKNYHSVVCTKGDPEHPLQKLDELWRNMHFPPETTSLVMLIKIIGITITSGSIPKIFQHFYQTVECNGNTHKVLQPEFISKLEILRDGLLQIYGSHPLIQHLLERDNFITLIALIGMNGQGIGTSGFADYCNRIDKMPMEPLERERVDKELDKIYNKMEETSGMFLDVEGTGLYELQSKLNHSCSPNVEIVFEHSNFMLTVKALRDIKEGEELFISYLSCQLNCSSRHTRRKFLMENYLFACECSKCVSQSGDPDVTSEEEDEDMDV